MRIEGIVLVLVSVLMTSYNHEKYISESIESVLNQSFKDFELIIIDDCSKDNSRRVIEVYQRKDHRIRAIFHEKNLGIAKTANHLLREATGVYVAIISSDDVWVESKLEKQIAILNSNNNLVLWSEGEIINADSVLTNETYTQRFSASYKNKRKSGDMFEIMLTGNLIILGSSLICERDFAMKIMFDPRLKYFNDYKFETQLAKEHKFFFIKEPLVKYRVHGKNTFLTSERGYAVDCINLLSFFLKEYSNQISKETKASLFLRIGGTYSKLNKKKLARFFSLHAFATAFPTEKSIPPVVFFLVNGDLKIFNFFIHLLEMGPSRVWRPFGKRLHNHL